jgi:hypothetical protein
VDALGGEHLVEGAIEHGIPVVDVEPHGLSLLPEMTSRACWVTHADSWFAVSPPERAFLV